jgi:hypothetical protein
MPPTTGARSAFMTSRTHAGFLENGNEAGKDDGDRQGTGKWHLPGPESDPVTAAGWLERAEPKDRFKRSGTVDVFCQAFGELRSTSLLLSFLQPPWQTVLVFLGQFPFFGGLGT